MLNLKVGSDDDQVKPDGKKICIPSCVGPPEMFHCGGTATLFTGPNPLRNKYEICERADFCPRAAPATVLPVCDAVKMPKIVRGDLVRGDAAPNHDCVLHDFGHKNRMQDKHYIITGTDTDTGKTTTSACLMMGLVKQGTRYWKPVQTGPKGEDRRRVQQFTGLPDKHFLSEVYNPSQPLSPHRAAELDGMTIEPEKILSAYRENLLLHVPLVIEGAGGPMVPLTRELLQLDLFVQMQAIAAAPIILVARTTLGTINHTLLSLAAIRSRDLTLAGIIFSGPDNADNIRTIAEFSSAPVLGHIPQLSAITPESLRAAFQRLKL